MIHIRDSVEQYKKYINILDEYINNINSINDIFNLYLFLQYRRVNNVVGNKFIEQFENEFIVMFKQGIIITDNDIKILKNVFSIILNTSDMEIDKYNFEFMYKHFTHLNDNGYKKIIGDSANYFYHGTSIQAAKQILNKGYFSSYEYTYKKDHTLISYNKVFFSSDMFFANIFGSLRGKGDKNRKHVVFEVSLDGYEVYYKKIRNDSDPYEYIIWGEVKADVIKKIYLCETIATEEFPMYENDAITKEITREELIAL